MSIDTPENSRYEPLGEIARGGMGVVLRVRDIDLGRELAMKRMAAAPEESPGSMETARFARFIDEVQITAQLDHPAIVPVHELGFDEDGTGWYTMKLVGGRELGEIFELARKNAEDWNPARAVGVLAQVCQAMAFAHEKSIIHRDLKPANVMVGELGEVYVMDWGLAKMIGADEHEGGSILSDSLGDSLMTMDGSVMGTPAFMAPEQAAGKVEEIDERSDIYGCGALLFQLLAGKAPYSGESSKEILSQVKSAEFSPEPLPSSAPTELAAICKKAMAYDPADRYSSARAMARDLQAWLDGRVVAAHESGRLAHFKKLVLRNRGLAVAMLVAFLSLAAFAVGQKIALNKERLQTEKTEAALETMMTGRGLIAAREKNFGIAQQWFRAAESLSKSSDQKRIQRMRQRVAAPMTPIPVAATWLPNSPSIGGNLQFSPNGKLLKIQSNQSRFHIFDRAKNRLLSVGEKDGFPAVAFHPSNNEVAVIQHRSHAIEIRDGDSFALLKKFQTNGSLGTLRAISIGPDGKFLAATGTLKTAVFDLKSKKLLKEITHPNDKPGGWVGFAPGGNRLVILMYDKGTMKRELHVFDQRHEFDTVGKPIKGIRKAAGNGFHFSRDGSEIIYAEASLRFYDAETAELIRKLPIGRVTDFSLDEKLIAAGSGLYDRISGEQQVREAFDQCQFMPGHKLMSILNPSVRLITRGTQDSVYFIGGENHRPDSTAFSPQGDFMATYMSSGLVRIWKLPKKETELMIPRGDQSEISPSGRYVMFYPRLALHDLETGSAVSLETTVLEPIHFLKFREDEAVAALVTKSGKLLQLDLKTKEVIGPEISIPTGTVAIAFLPDGRSIAGADASGTYFLVDLKTAEIKTLFQRPAAKVAHLRVIDDGRALAAWAWREGVDVWDFETESFRFPTIPAAVSTYVEFADQGFFVVGSTRKYSLHDTTTGSSFFSGQFQRENERVTGFDFSPDGDSLLISTLKTEFQRLKIDANQNVHVDTQACALNTRHFHLPEISAVAALRIGVESSLQLLDYETLKPLSPVQYRESKPGNPTMSSDRRILSFRNLLPGTQPYLSLHDFTHLESEAPEIDFDLATGHRMENGELIPLSDEEWYELWQKRTPEPAEESALPQSDSKHRE